MGFFTLPTEPVDLGGGNVAHVRRLTFEENQKAISLSMLPGGATDNVRYLLEVAKRAAVDWRGDAFEGKPCTPENVCALPTDVAVKIANAAIDLINTPATEGE